MISKIKKKIIFFIFFILPFFPIEVYGGAGISLEEEGGGARNKRLGLVEKTIQSTSVKHEQLLKNIELGNIEEIRAFLKSHKYRINFNTIKGINPLVHAVQKNNISAAGFWRRKYFSRASLDCPVGPAFQRIIKILLRQGFFSHRAPTDPWLTAANIFLAGLRCTA